MEIILLKDINKLGKEGARVRVKEGYARNYLIPRKFAVVSTPEAVKMIERREKKKREDAAREKRKFEEIAQKISAISCTLTVEAGIDDKIFGSVTPEMVRNALRQEGLEIDKRNVIIGEPIKKTGVYQIPIRLHPEVTASLRIWVVKK